ncbi:MAG: ATP-binding protein [Capnocytophaga sp.]|nr:ATP-binding protein [Capnocytophaga sp.]
MNYIFSHKKSSTSLRTRIFLSMILLTILSFILIGGVTIYQYKKQAKLYHDERLLRKEEQIKAQINYIFSQTTYPIESKYIPLIFKNEIYQIANLENINFNLYDINGTLLKSSQANLSNSLDNNCLSDSLLIILSSSVDKRVIQYKNMDNGDFQSSYSYINDLQYKPILILNIPNFENDSFNEGFLRNSLYTLSGVYVLLFIGAIVVSYFISKYITKSLKTIKEKLHSTKFSNVNEKIILDNPSTEIEELITAYNAMIDEIEQSKKELAKNEREKTWRDMAKQIAHEIKNPLTPMRLTIQNFERKFDPEEEDIKEKVTQFSESLIQHIDTLNDIASAFSYFTTMPEEQKEQIDINAVVRRTLSVFDANYISFESNVDKLITLADKNQINRMLVNLIKNAIQATDSILSPKIEVCTLLKKDEWCIQIKDNGIGIEQELQEKIFEPKFTTKSTGSGLGLAMVRHIVLSHKGRIELLSKVGEGTTFVIHIPL